MRPRTTVLLLLSFSILGTSVGQSPRLSTKLSEEGNTRRDAHDFLMDTFTRHHKATIRGSREDGVLEEVVVDDRRIEVIDGERITLPPGSQRVAGMFRYLAFRGTNLDKIVAIRVLPFAPDSHPHQSVQKPDFYRVQMPSTPVPKAGLPEMQIVFELPDGQSCSIDQVLLNSQGRLSTRFNDIPFRNLGEEYPRVSVPISVDVLNELSMEGHVELERQKWFRYYAAPGGVDASFERWAADRNFVPGRQILKLHPALVKGYSPSQPRLAERRDRPGSADLSFFDQYKSGRDRVIPPFQNIPYAMCFDEWPDFMSRHPGGRGTPLVEHFSDAADLAAAYVKDEIADSGRTATWWEVKNESTIKAEWDYHFEKDVDSWKLLADFHNRVADAIHTSTPSVRVGGPTSAWMQLQVGDFNLYRSQRDFMTNTAGKLDFYSHHFYEDIDSLGAHENREVKYTNYLLGRFEAIFDMFQAHMRSIDHIRPMLITECGSLQAGRSPSDNWLRLRSWNAYLVKFMQRPEQIDLTVPFVFLQIPWNPTSGNAAFTPKEGKGPGGPIEDFEQTPIANFFELWKDFDGRRLPVSLDQKWVDVVAVHNDDAIRVAVTNMGGRRLSVDLSSLAADSGATSITQTRLRYEDGQVVFENDTAIQDPSRIPLDVEETTIVRFSIARPIQPSGITVQRSWYAHETAVKSVGKPMDFLIKADELSTIESATLVVGVQRNGGLDQPVIARLNSKAYASETGWAVDFKNLFATVEIEVLPSQISETNEITIAPMSGLTITSVNLRTTHSESK